MSTRRTSRVIRSKSGQAGPAAAPAVPRVSGPPTAAKASVAGKGKGKQPAGKQPATVAKALELGSSMLPSLSGQPAAEAAIQAVRDDLEIDTRRRALRSAASAAAEAAERSVLTRRASAEAVRRGETPGVQPKRRVPSGVGEFEEQVPYIDPAAELAAQDAVEQWMKTFTPGAPTADAQGILNREFLEYQRQAIVDGTMFIPPPLSVEGLAREALMRDGSGSLAVQQEILKLVGERRQELVESVAAKLLTLERCAASAYALDTSGIAANIKSWLTDLLIGGSLPEGLMTSLADFIQTGGTYDILMNPAGWLMGELGALVTQDAINTYIAIWLTNQLIGAQMFAQMAGDKKLNDKINLTSEDLLKKIQKNQSFIEQISVISSNIYGLFQESLARLMAGGAAAFNAPEMIIQEITRVGEERIVNMSMMPQMIMAQAAEDAQAAAERAQDRRARAVETARTYGDAEAAAQLAVRAPVQAAGLSDFGMELLSQIGGATAQLLRSALVLAGMRNPQPTDTIVRMNKNIADLLIGRYLGYIQQMGYAIVVPRSEREPVIRAPLSDQDSEKIVDQIAGKGPAAAAVQIADLIDRRVAEINPAVLEEPCERRPGLADMAYSPEDDEEEVETQPLYAESQESWHSAESGPVEGGARKRKRHSTRSSTSSKSSKSGTRKHGKSKRVKKGGAKTRHVRLPHGAGRRTRKHSKRGRK